MVVGDQLVFRIYIHSVKAWMSERRGRNAEMYFLCSGIPEDINDPLTRRTADYGIIDKDHSLTLKHAPYGTELDPDSICSLILRRSYEASSDILILHQPYLIGDSALS